MYNILNILNSVPNIAYHRSGMPVILTKEPPPVAQHNRDYIAKLRKWKIAHLSATLAYDTITNTTKCIIFFRY